MRIARDHRAHFSNHHKISHNVRIYISSVVFTNLLMLFDFLIEHYECLGLHSIISLSSNREHIKSN